MNLDLSSRAWYNKTGQSGFLVASNPNQFLQGALHPPFSFENGGQSPPFLDWDPPQAPASLSGSLGPSPAWRCPPCPPALCPQGSSLGLQPLLLLLAPPGLGPLPSQQPGRPAPSAGSPSSDAAWLLPHALQTSPPRAPHLTSPATPHRRPRTPCLAAAALPWHPFRVSPSHRLAHRVCAWP